LAVVFYSHDGAQECAYSFAGIATSLPTPRILSSLITNDERWVGASTPPLLISFLSKPYQSAARQISICSEIRMF
jgi:hypothetical protein